jgi:hypothetical protein
MKASITNCACIAHNGTCNRSRHPMSTLKPSLKVFFVDSDFKQVSVPDSATAAQLHKAVCDKIALGESFTECKLKKLAFWVHLTNSRTL